MLTVALIHIYKGVTTVLEIQAVEGVCLPSFVLHKQRTSLAF